MVCVCVCGEKVTSHDLQRNSRFFALSIIIEIHRKGVATYYATKSINKQNFGFIEQKKCIF
jgi:hypothetical protein